MSVSQDSNITVIGGGMIGSCLGLGLAQQGHPVSIVEPYQPKPFDAQESPDCRVSAVSISSIKLLKSLNVWQRIMDMRSQPYNTMTACEYDAAKVELTAESVGQTCLGHMIENGVLQRALYEACMAHDNIQWLNHGFKQLVSNNANHGKSVILDNGQKVSTSMVVAADGANSRVRNALSIGVTGWQYKQHVLGVVIEHDGDIDNSCTWQQFSPSGPMAYLPLYDNYGCLVWYHTPEVVKELSNANTDTLQQHIIQAFPAVLGDFKVIKKASFPIARHHAQRYSRDNVVLVGDAAHSINPLAGQGLNLGFHDVNTLLKLIKEDLSAESLTRIFREYETIRRPHNQAIMTAMDVLYATFSNDFLPAKITRNLAMKLASNGFLNKKILRYALDL